MGKASKGNRKSSKKDQPKRIRYNNQRRGHLRKVRELENHCQKCPNDIQAKESWDRLRGEFLKEK